MLFQVAQLFGAALVLLAFWLNQRGTLGPARISYNAITFTGTSILTVVALIGGQWGFVALNVFGCAIAARGLYTLISARIRQP